MDIKLSPLPEEITLNIKNTERWEFPGALVVLLHSKRTGIYRSFILSVFYNCLLLIDTTAHPTKGATIASLVIPSAPGASLLR